MVNEPAGTETIGFPAWRGYIEQLAPLAEKNRGALGTVA